MALQAVLTLLPTINNIPDVGISWGQAMAGLGSPDLDIGESARISIFNSPFSDSVKLDFKEMLTTTNNIYTIYCTLLTYFTLLL